MSSKQREALQEAKTLLEEIHSAYSDRQGDISMYPLRKVIGIVDKALAEPPRNCDVGTAEEQSKRFKKYCALNKDFEWGCEKCPIFPYKIIKCEFIWAQIPYESEAK